LKIQTSLIFLYDKFIMYDNLIMLVVPFILVKI